MTDLFRTVHSGTAQALAREHTEQAIRTLVNIMQFGDTQALRMAAAVHLLDRAWGRPSTAAKSHDADADRRQLDVDETLALMRERARRARNLSRV